MLRLVVKMIFSLLFGLKNSEPLWVLYENWPKLSWQTFQIFGDNLKRNKICLAKKQTFATLCNPKCMTDVFLKCLYLRSPVCKSLKSHHASVSTILYSKVVLLGTLLKVLVHYIFREKKGKFLQKFYWQFFIKLLPLNVK